ncbi:hypothetical protein BSKO_06389 [Bryopsis sp. KO-2023]|nr:hypothetical protein BSKO_06389 [Bryopsis sp. KO-2023]
MAKYSALGLDFGEPGVEDLSFPPQVHSARWRGAGIFNKPPGYDHGAATKRKKILDGPMTTEICREVLNLVGPGGYALLEKEINLREGESFRTNRHGWVGDGRPFAKSFSFSAVPGRVSRQMESKRPSSVYQAVWPQSEGPPDDTSPVMVTSFNSWFEEYGECSRVTVPVVPSDRKSDVGWVTKRPQGAAIPAYDELRRVKSARSLRVAFGRHGFSPEDFSSSNSQRIPFTARPPPKAPESPTEKHTPPNIPRPSTAPPPAKPSKHPRAKEILARFGEQPKRGKQMGPALPSSTPKRAPPVRY